jgi:hemolysin III
MTKTNEQFNSISHLVGAALALAGAVVLVVSAAMDGGTKRIVAFSIYGASLFLLYLVSTLYHSLLGRAKDIFRVLDHQAIYLLIAGTYTPVVLVTLKGSTSWWMFGAIWSMAIVGLLMDAFPKRKSRLLSLILYVAMGWLIVLVIKPLLAVLPFAGFMWLLAGGLFYSFGIIFYVYDHRHSMLHGVWHLFVLAGSICHYFSILFYV